MTGGSLNLPALHLIGFFYRYLGDIDAFIKVIRPDGKNEALGLAVLDEPAAKQSDPSVLELQLRAISKQSTSKAAKVIVLIY